MRQLVYTETDKKNVISHSAFVCLRLGPCCINVHCVHCEGPAAISHNVPQFHWWANGYMEIYLFLDVVVCMFKIPEILRYTNAL